MIDNHQNWESYMQDFFETCDITTITKNFIHNISNSKQLNSNIKDFFKVSYNDTNTNKYFEYMLNPQWRKFVLSVYYADMLCYTKPEDQVDFSRLIYILNKFPQGFSVWWAEFENDILSPTQNTSYKKNIYPLAYTGWYYVEKETFNHIEQLQYNKDIKITNRFFLPTTYKTPYIYIFNYSIIKNLVGTKYSRMFIKDYAQTINALDCQGMFCATVSSDGIRVAQKFNMKKIGHIISDEGIQSDTLYLYKKEQ